MKRATSKLTIWALVALMFCSTFAIGCEPLNWFGTGFSVNFVVPLGLAGTPGLLNPFGIVQAVVNAALGVTTTTEGTAAFPVPATSTTPTVTLPGLGTVG
ncbi:MAG TPA: hypothetical protein VMV94_16840 [Phycisphaerae bacterium]|nr:hypothetical protein [Phycisphaerae bacterium]